MRRHTRFRSQRVRAFVFGMGALALIRSLLTSWQAGQPIRAHREHEGVKLTAALA